MMAIANSRRIMGLGAAAAAALAVASAGAQELAAPEKRISVTRNFAHQPVPNWQNGYVLAWDSVSTAVPYVFAFDPSGRLVTQSRMEIPQATRIIVRNVAAAPAGTLVVAGSAGTADGQFASYLAWVSPGGKLERLVGGSMFAALRVCFASDGTLWAFGRARTPNYQEQPGHDVLRQYSNDGRMVRSLLPRESFARDDHRHPAEGSFLVAAKDRVGLYSTSAKEWIEVSLSGDVLGRWKGIDTGPGMMITGAAVTSSGSVYVSVQTVRGNETKATFFRFNREQGVWALVDGAKVLPPSRVGAIVGADDNHLVIRSSANSSLDFSWVPVE